MPVKDLDAIDCNILNMLQEDARISNVDLSEKVHLSPSPCLRRVRRLESEGTDSRLRHIARPRRSGFAGECVCAGVSRAGRLMMRWRISSGRSLRDQKSWSAI